MRARFIATTLLCLGCGLWFATSVAAHEKTAATNDTTTTLAESANEVVIKSLPDSGAGYLSLLKPPVSRRLRSGFMTLNPGVSGERHSTEGYEEMIMVLQGSGAFHSGERVEPVGTHSIIYVPPHTEHFLSNTGSDTLKYIYVVTKVEL
jgi:mannose-6-phosphate isomerase-like protein (cupin superfamily)